MDTRPQLEQLQRLKVIPAGGGEALLAVYRGALARLELTTLDYLTIRDLAGYADSDEPALHALLIAMADVLTEGSLCLPLTEPLLTERLRRFLGDRAPATAAAIRELLAKPPPAIVGDSTDAYRPLVLHQGRHGKRFLYFHKYRLLEAQLEGQLRGLLTRVSSPLVEPRQLREMLAEVAERTPLRRAGEPVVYNADQRLAIVLGMLRDFSLISGGPGTGKTSIVVGLLRCLVRAGIAVGDIRLAAPTGRAAQQFTETIRRSIRSLGEPPPAIDAPLVELRGETLHRLLRYQPAHNRFRHHAGHPIPARVVIIDEVSMVDVATMTALLDALAPTTRLVFLGDKDQLPSIEAGAVLAELIPQDAAERFTAPMVEAIRQLVPDAHLPLTIHAEPLADRVTILKHSFRSEQGILHVARRVNQQDPALAQQLPTLPEPVDPLAPESAGCHLYELGDEHGTRWEQLLDAWARGLYGDTPVAPVKTAYRQLVQRLRGHDLDLPVIPPEHPATPLLDELFAVLRAGRVLTVVRDGPFGSIGVNRHLAMRLRPKLSPGSQGALFAGCPLMILRNDYRRELFNGDVGVVLATEDGLERALFPRFGEYLSLPLGVLPATEPAFAVTVHKSQGSEYDRVLLALPPVSGHRLLCKEILYTGLTRARHFALICGTRRILGQTIGRHIQRESALDIWQRAPVGPPDPAQTAGLPLFDGIA